MKLLLVTALAGSAVAATDKYFTSTEYPMCEVKADGHMYIKYHNSHPLHAHFACTHAANGACSCTGHPTHGSSGCKQMIMNDGRKVNIDGMCVGLLVGPNDITDRTPITLVTQPGSGEVGGGGNSRQYFMSFSRVNGGSAHAWESHGTTGYGKDKWLLKKCLAGSKCGTSSLNDASEWTPAGPRPTTGKPSPIRYGDIVAILPARGDFKGTYAKKNGPMPDNWLQDEDAALNCAGECRYRLWQGGTKSKPGPTQYPPETADQLMKVVSMDGSKAVGDKLQYGDNVSFELVNSDGDAFDDNTYLSCAGHRYICRRRTKWQEETYMRTKDQAGMKFTVLKASTEKCINGFKFIGSYDGYCTGEGIERTHQATANHPGCWTKDCKEFFPPTGRGDLAGMQEWCSLQPECLGYGQHYDYSTVYKASRAGSRLFCPSPEGVLNYQFLNGAGYNNCAPFHVATNGCYVKFPCDSLTPYEYEGEADETGQQA